MLHWLSRFHNTRDKADTLLLLAACLTVLAPHMLHLPLWTSALCLVTLAWRAWITLAGRRMPPLSVLLPVALASTALVQVEFKTLLGRDPGVAMLVLLLAFKLLEMRARRDLYVVVFLSLFILLTSFFYSQSMGSAALTVLALVLLLAALMAFQYTGARPPLRRRLRTAAMTVALAAPLTAVLFVLFPRIQGPLWGMPGDAAGASSGLSDSMAPGTVADLAMSDELAFRVRFFDPLPARSDLYWRAIVLSDFDGRTWTRRVRPVPKKPPSVRARGRETRYQITQEPSAQRWLFALEMPRALPYINDKRAYVTSELELMNETPIGQRVRYEMSSYSNAAFQLDESAVQLNHNLRLPFGYNPRTLAWGHELRRRHNDPALLIGEVLTHFRRQPYVYTLRPPLLGRHTVDEFLFVSRAGFCEHYAGAFVMLMRAAGIPARVVTGYQGGEINPVDGFMTVRQSDAHAWAEVWLDGRGWVRVDPTAAVAPERVRRNLASALGAGGGVLGNIGLGAGRLGWLDPLRYNVAALGNAWNQWILDYTPQRQRELFSRLGLSDYGATVLLTVLALAAIALALLPFASGRERQAPLDALYTAFCQAMARRGYPRLAHEGPLDYRRRLLAAEPSGEPLPRAAIEAFLALYVRLNYAPPNAASSTEPAGRFGKDRPQAGVSALNQLKNLLAQCR